MSTVLSKGLSAVEAERIARKIGVEVRGVNATGEMVFVFDGRRVVMNARRKDASKMVITHLRRAYASWERAEQLRKISDDLARQRMGATPAQPTPREEEPMAAQPMRVETAANKPGEKKTLLQRAMEAPAPARRLRVREDKSEYVDLALAVVAGRVSWAQAAVALGRTGANAHHKLYLELFQAAERGELRVTKADL